MQVQAHARIVWCAVCSRTGCAVDILLLHCQVCIWPSSIWQTLASPILYLFVCAPPCYHSFCAMLPQHMSVMAADAWHAHSS